MTSIAARGVSGPLLAATAWLDGLRGIAALLVYFHHHQKFAHSDKNGAIMDRSFGYNHHHHFSTLPIVRLLFSGAHFAVAVFFVASGYTLSIRPCYLLHARRYSDLGDVIASALFRRWLRLFAPVVGTTLLFIIAWHVCAVDIHGAVRQSIWTAELATWLRQLKDFSFVFCLDPGFSGYSPLFDYNMDLWTIPLEMRGSLLIYAVILAVGRFPCRTRLGWQIVLILYFLYVVDGWYLAMFITGMVLCELNHLSPPNPKKRWSLIPRGRDLGVWLVFFGGLYLGGVPHAPSIKALGRNPGWYYPSLLKPAAVVDPKWFYLYWAATLVVGTCSYLSPIRWFLETPSAQYLGGISYSLYLVQNPVMRIVGEKVYESTGIWSAMSEPAMSPLGLESAFVIAQLILLPLTLLAAHLVTRLIDKPSIKLSKWLYDVSMIG